MEQHWLYKSGTRRKIWIFSAIILLIIVILELFITLHPHFLIENIFGFYAGYGFLACVAMIIFAKLLGYFIKRKDDYYDK